jgi:biopolymer transport protein ExbD
MSKRRHRRLKLGHAAANTQGDINVTPLVDVVLVLLIIFMVVTPLLEKNIPVRTPNSEKVEQPTEVPPDQLVVYVDKNGTIRLNADHVEAAELSARLRAKLDVRSAADRVVFIVADDQLSYATLVSVLDSAKLAGADVLGFATEPPTPEVAL